MSKHTFLSEAVLAGIGTHTGAECRVVVAPAEDGITFNGIQLRIDNVAAESGFTSIGKLHTIEHLCSAMHALGIDCARITTEAPEMPIFDGSTAPIVELLQAAGMRDLGVPQCALYIRRRVEYEDERGRVSLSPYERLELDVEIDYPEIAAIGRQYARVSLADYPRIAAARSFARMKDIELWHSKGLALGASLATGIGIGEDGRVMNPEGLRSPDEFVLHKVLDAIGDLYTCGMPVIGLYESFKGGHRHNHELMLRVMADEENYEVKDL
ncbi:MAG: UDP-3-O-acyl-N-acetylglucosamine deacetylase [Rickettsiales bacterium]|jgi:UDP-3-O-[3-hydroxymyristoyl] N-acetylglucosamine deacetylase|nr:UDP-3-O-acyl-N-acetylglucosamine deacetylase [Rickettsiales bacterium]